MRVNVDSGAKDDPRLHLLARHLKINVFEVMGRIIRVWFICYDRRSAVLQPIEIDIASDREGFADAMIASGLGLPDEHGIYIRGVTERIRFLENQSEKGRKSGEVRRKGSALQAPAQQGFPFGSTTPGTSVEQRFTAGRTNPRTYSLAPDQDQAPDQALDHVPRDPGDAARSGPGPANDGEAVGASAGQDPERGGGSDSNRSQGKPAREVPDQAVTLAVLLMGMVVTNHPTGRLAKTPQRVKDATAERWGDTIDKLNRIDKFSWGEIQGMITWCQRHSFWRTVILGADNLRDKWDKMAAQRDGDQRPPGHPQRAVPMRQKGPTALAVDEQRELERLEQEQPQ